MVNIKYAKGFALLVLILSLVYVAIAVMPTAITVSISPLNPNIVAGTTQQFTATTLDQNSTPISATLSWSSSNTFVGTINSAGLFTASTSGTTTITVTAANGTLTKTASTTATVTALQNVLTTVTISPLNPIIAAGSTQQFTATTLDQNNAPMGATLSWGSSNTTVGSINSASGSFIASNAGSTTITVTATNGTVTKTASTTATVTAAQQQNVLTTVTISPINPSIVAGNTQSFTATTRDQNNAAIGATLSWASSNTTVGSINSASGSFTASTAGTTTISVTATNGTVTKTASTTVTVTSANLITSVMISPATVSVVVGNTLSFTAKDQLGNVINANVVWNSSNTTAGTIDIAGVFKALAPGSTTVTATNGTVSGSTIITVTSTNLITAITISPVTVSVVVGNTTSFTAKDQLSNVINANVVWNSSNITVGTINTEGLFMALAPGSTTVTATNVTVSGSAIVTVTSTDQISAITISPSLVSVVVGNTTSFIAKDQLSNVINANVVWNSSNTTVGLINQMGVFTASAVGTTIITAMNGSIIENATVTVIPPALNPVTNLTSSRGATWIKWTWTNPGVPFNNTIVKINGINVTFQTNTSDNFYNYTSLSPGSSYTISLQTVDMSGNIDPTIVSNTISTLNTPEGTNVIVHLSDNLNVIFSQVDTEGNTSVSIYTKKQSGWSDHNFTKVGNYYDITSDAITASGSNITVELKYDPAGIIESNVKIYHLNGSWIDVTTNMDIANKKVSGNVTSLSPFVVGVPPGPKITVISPPVATNIETSGSDSRTFQVSVSQDATVNWFLGSSQVNSSSVSANVPIEYTYKSTSIPDNYTFSVTANNSNGNDTASWTWIVRSKTYFKGNRVWNGAKPYEYSLDYTWDPLSFYAFYYDLDIGSGNEALKIHLNSYTDRSISRLPSIFHPTLQCFFPTNKLGTI